jgi:hypothetical protein
MTPDQLVKIAAIVSSLVTVLVTISLFLAREYLEARRRKKQAATVLLLYGYSALRALERSSGAKLPFTMKDVLECARDVIHIEGSRALVGALDAALYSMEVTEAFGAPAARDERMKLGQELCSALDSHVHALGLQRAKLGRQRTDTESSRMAIK